MIDVRVSWVELDALPATATAAAQAPESIGRGGRRRRVTWQPIMQVTKPAIRSRSQREREFAALL